MHQFFDYILGLKKLSESEIQEERDVRMRSLYLDPMVNFSDRVDQLLEALQRVCFTTNGIYLHFVSFSFYLALY
jgi:hypothetical protein